MTKKKLKLRKREPAFVPAFGKAFEPAPELTKANLDEARELLRNNPPAPPEARPGVRESIQMLRELADSIEKRGDVPAALLVTVVREAPSYRIDRASIFGWGESQLLGLGALSFHSAELAKEVVGRATADENR